MVRIRASEHIVTLINVFTVEPAKQEALVDLLARATDETMCHLPGFVSASIHRSVDGMRVTNYAQWRSRQDFEAMLHNPAAQPHLQAAAALATSVDPHLYDVVTVRDRDGRASRIAVGAAAVGALAVGAFAVGAFAVGALAIGRVAIGALTVGRSSMRKLSIDDVAIARLGVRELVIDRELPMHSARALPSNAQAVIP